MHDGYIYLFSAFAEKMEGSLKVCRECSEKNKDKKERKSVGRAARWRKNRVRMYSVCNKDLKTSLETIHELDSVYWSISIQTEIVIVASERQNCNKHSGRNIETKGKFSNGEKQGGHCV